MSIRLGLRAHTGPVVPAEMGIGREKTRDSRHLRPEGPRTLALGAPSSGNRTLLSGNVSSLPRSAGCRPDLERARGLSRNFKKCIVD